MANARSIPEDATRRIVLLSRCDEARHVSYGVARLRHRIDTARLEAAGLPPRALGQLRQILRRP